MPDILEQSTEEPSRLWKRLFRYWIAAGFLLVVMIVLGHCASPPRPDGYPTFIFVGQEREHETYVRWVPGLTFLAECAMAHSLIGVFVFYRRGCVVFLLAGVFFMCGCELERATLGWLDH
jgi:hypothetical protein